MRLCDHLQKAPSEVLATHDSYDFARWQVYDKLNPIGQRRGDIQAATIVQTLENLLRVRQAHERVPPLADFVFRADFQADHRERIAQAEAEASPEGQALMAAYRKQEAEVKARVREQRRRKAEAVKAAAAVAAAEGGRRRNRKRR